MFRSGAAAIGDPVCEVGELGGTVIPDYTDPSPVTASPDISVFVFLYGKNGTGGIIREYEGVFLYRGKNALRFIEGTCIKAAVILFKIDEICVFGSQDIGQVSFFF